MNLLAVVEVQLAYWTSDDAAPFIIMAAYGARINTDHMAYESHLYNWSVIDMHA
jgi:hypothetical protein